MKIKNIIAVLITTTLITIPCFAKEGLTINPFYIKSSAMLGKPQDNNNVKGRNHTASKFFSASGDFGYQITDNIAIN